jgi:MarR family transcriptional regulator, organic hydroperoxide resistance regulator
MAEIGVFPRKESPGFIIYRTAVLLKAGLRRAFQMKGLDITPEQWSVLGSLWEEEGVHQSLLADKTDKDRHNITRILSLLEQRGLILRKPDKDDKRRQRVFLTQSGKGLELELVPIATEFMRQAFQGLTDHEMSSLKHTLRRITSNLGDTSRPAGTARAGQGTAADSKPKRTRRRRRPAIHAYSGLGTNGSWAGAEADED